MIIIGIIVITYPYHPLYHTYMHAVVEQIPQKAKATSSKEREERETSKQTIKQAN